MTERAKLVLALLRTADSWIPSPQTWRKNPLCYREDSGEAPSRSVRCDACKGEGTIGKGVKRTCARCKGRGFRMVDSYTEREVGHERTEVGNRQSYVECDSCGGRGVFGNNRRCEICGGRGRRETEDFGLLDSTLTRLRAAERIRMGVESEFGFAQALGAKERLHRQGSYAELEEALLKMKGQSCQCG